ncbi:hypothetical protein HP532_09240 [Pseudomonas sp. CrR25]|nr:hypothetical protein [Pseudomonas sp. CrR25]
MVSLEDFLHLSWLNNTYWAIADQCSSVPVSYLFSDSARLQLGSLDLQGPDAIHHFFIQRQLQNKQVERVTRHVSSGFLPAYQDQKCVVARSVVVVFAGSGSRPIPSDSPSTIADVEDVFVRDDGGQWLFQRRVVKPVFVGASAANFAR